MSVANIPIIKNIVVASSLFYACTTMSSFPLLQLILTLFGMAKEMRIDIDGSSYNYSVITETLKEGWQLMSMYFIALFHSI